MNKFCRVLFGIYPKFLSGPSAPKNALRHLPIIEIPSAIRTLSAIHSALPHSQDALAVVVSGDGGWARLVRDLSRNLVQRGLPVVGLDSLRFFWHPRTSDDAGLALEQILRHYLEVWRKSRVLLIGYSRGANVLPFMINRLPADLRRRIGLVVLMAPSAVEEFEVCVRNWIWDLAEISHCSTFTGKILGHFLHVAGYREKKHHSVWGEMEKIKDQRILCYYGREEENSMRDMLKVNNAQAVCLEGGHHFNRDYEALARMILAEWDESERLASE